MNLTFDLCATLLTQVAQLTGLTYKQVNVILFCGIWPAITIGLIVWIGRLYRAVNRNRHPPYIWVLRQEARILSVSTDPEWIETYLKTWCLQTAPDLTLWRAFNGSEYSIGATRQNLPKGFGAEESPGLNASLVDELVDLFVARNLPETALDEHVHDAASQEASNVNNGGVPDQVGYLIATLGKTETRKILEQAEPETEAEPSP